MNELAKIKIENFPKPTAEELREQIRLKLAEIGKTFEEVHLFFECTIYIPAAIEGRAGYVAKRDKMLLPPTATDIVAVKGTEAYERLSETATWRHGWLRWDNDVFPVWDAENIVIYERS